MSVRQEDLRLHAWKETFDRVYVNRINMKIIDTINKLIGCKSAREFSTACAKKERWNSHVDLETGESSRPIYYVRLRETARFLGIPPWVLVAGTRGNDEIRTLFEEAPSEVETIEFVNPEKSLTYLKEYFTQAAINKAERAEVQTSLQTVEKYIPHGSYFAADSVEELLYYAQDKDSITDHFDYNIQLPSPLGPEYRGTLSFSKGEYTHGLKRLVTKTWQSAWFAIEIDHLDETARLHVDQFLDRIQSALHYRHTWVVEAQPNPATTLILVSWHSGVRKSGKVSHETEQLNRQKIEFLVQDKIKDSHQSIFKLHAYDHVLNKIPQESELREKYTDFLSWVSEDIDTTPTKEHIADPLSHAVETGAMLLGQSLYFNSRFLPKKSLLEITQPVVTVTPENGKASVSYHGQCFGLTKLTARILRELNLFEWMPRVDEPSLFWGTDKFFHDPSIWHVALTDRPKLGFERYEQYLNFNKD